MNNEKNPMREFAGFIKYIGIHKLTYEEKIGFISEFNNLLKSGKLQQEFYDNGEKLNFGSEEPGMHDRIGYIFELLKKNVEITENNFHLFASIIELLLYIVAEPAYECQPAFSGTKKVIPSVTNWNEMTEEERKRALSKHSLDDNVALLWSDGADL